jgi:hypothetical protein
VSQVLLAILGSAAGPVQELERPFDPRARYRVEARYLRDTPDGIREAKVRYVHQSLERLDAAERLFDAEVADVREMGFAAVIRLLDNGAEVKRVTTEGDF